GPLGSGKKRRRER
nr:Chain D, TNRC6A [Mus musculus]5UMZ_E Chain E, TNRC6A [Mus musculus]